MPVFCSKCGVKMTGAEKFCRDCGQPTEEEPLLVARPSGARNEVQQPEALTEDWPGRRPKSAAPLLIGLAAFAGAAIVGVVAGRLVIQPAPAPIPRSGTPQMAASVEMPDVVGITEAQAREVIRAKALKIEVTTGSSLDIPPGHVVSQYPVAGSGVSRDATIRVRVSSGPPAGARVAGGNTTIVVSPGSVARTEEDESRPVPLHDSAYRFRLSDSDLAGKSNWELDVMRNTIFARYGRRFGRRDLQDYFDRQSWYRPRSDFQESMMSGLDKRNAAHIASYQAGERQASNSYSPPPRPSYSSAPSYNYQLSASDLAGKSGWELDIMRNTIFAKYGRIFRRRDLQEYFDRQPWYRRNSSFRESWLTGTEKRNAVLIANYQKGR